MTKVIERKLGRERAWGQAYKDDKVIEIDPRQGSKSYFETLIHEKLHIMFPEWEEGKVDRNAKILTSFLWKNKYRKVNL